MRGSWVSDTVGLLDDSEIGVTDECATDPHALPGFIVAPMAAPLMEARARVGSFGFVSASGLVFFRVYCDHAVF